MQTGLPTLGLKSSDESRVVPEHANFASQFGHERSVAVDGFSVGVGHKLQHTEDESCR